MKTDLIEEYKKKIEIILDNSLGCSEGNAPVEKVHTWLWGEWLCSDMEMDERRKLHAFIDECAKERMEKQRGQ